MGVSLQLWMKVGIVIRQTIVMIRLWPHHKLLHYFRSFVRVTRSLGNLSLSPVVLTCFLPSPLHPSSLLLVPLSTLPFSHKHVISIHATNGWNTWVPPSRPCCQLPPSWPRGTEHLSRSSLGSWARPHDDALPWALETAFFQTLFSYRSKHPEAYPGSYMLAASQCPTLWGLFNPENKSHEIVTQVWPPHSIYEDTEA